MPLFSHQSFSVAHNEKTPIVMDCSDAGTGKTLVRVIAFAKRRRAGGGALLVLAPRSLLNSVWFNEFAKFAPDMKVSVALAENRTEAFAEQADVYVTNHDATRWLAQQKPAFFAKFSELVVDESAAYKKPKSLRSAAVAKIVKYFTHRTVMTATPTSNGVCDIWHQVFLLDGGKRLGTSYYRFRDVVCEPIRVGRSEHAIKWVDREDAEEAVFNLISDIVVRHKLDDCVDLPKNHMYTVDFLLSPKQQRAYMQMEATQMLAFKNTPILAVNAAAVATKLLQVASGAVYANDNTVHAIDNSRYKLVLDLVEQRKHSLVFFLWGHQRDALIAEAKKRGITYAVIDGATSDADRSSIVDAYQKGAYTTIFAHPKSAGHGLTFTAGTATIWASPTYDLEIFIQGSSRQRRIGQTQKTETILVVAKGTIEERVVNDILLPKGKRMTKLLDLFQTSTHELDKNTQKSKRTKTTAAVV